MPTTTLLRNDVATLADEAQAELETIWREVSTAAAAREALSDVLPELIQLYGAEASVVAADWYNELRIERAVRGTFAASPVNLGSSGAQELAGWGVSPLFRDTPDWDAARTLVSGGLQRRIANYARTTVMRSSVRDPQAKGWRRVGSAKCDFCRMLIGRGAVYREPTADFDAHDHCNCAAEPAFQ